MNILVTGGSGQLGTCLKDEVNSAPRTNTWYFADRSMVDITDINSVRSYVIENKIDVIVNCAAYTNVEKAEEEYDLALSINCYAVKNLTQICREYNMYLIHISTDFVFDGNHYKPYYTIDDCNPINAYGKTKYYGECEALEYEKSIIIRTSWLYSEYGKNFYRTMTNRIKDRKETRVVMDQIGSPTYARDLAEFIIFMVEEQDNDNLSAHTGIYHFTNNGCCSWYDFAAAIEFLYLNSNSDYIKPCSSKEYPSKALRPFYSVLNKRDLYEFPYEPRHWLVALKDCIINDFLKHH